MHTVKRVCTLVLTGLLALPMAAPAGAAAASFSDLPSSHWAYIAMTEAAGYGILQGTGANTMSPSAPLTWPQFLAMAARAFAPEEYARSAASGAAWDQAGLDAARSAGLLEGLDEAALTGAVTRQDAAVVLCNALPEEYTPSFWDQPIDPTALSNWGRMDSLRQEAVAELARRCVIQGKADGSFGYADPLQRCDGAVLLMRVLEQVDNSCRGESQTVTLHILNADTGEALLPDQQVETEVSTYLSSLANGLDVGYYVYDYDRETASYTSTACDSYTLYFRPMTGAEIQEEQFWEKVERGEAAYEDYYKQDFWLSFQGDNARKHILLFGDESKSRFASQEEAAAAMTAVTVPVWQLSGGEKVSSTLTLSVHAALAEDVKEIFTELIEHGYVTGKPYMGIQVKDVSDELQSFGITAGARVSYVAEGSCAQKAGLQVDDIITAIDDTAIDSSTALTAALSTNYKAGDTATLTIVRNQQEQKLTITFDEKNEQTESANQIQQDSQQNQQGQSGNGYYYQWPFGGFNW